MAEILIVNNAESGIKEFAIPIEKIIEGCGSTSSFIEYADSQYFNFNEVDGVILTGSPQGNDIVGHHLPYFQWIKSCPKPIFGICAGHHIVGALFGSELLRSVEKESGDHEVDIVKNDVLFEGLPHIFKVKQMHNDSVTLPDAFNLLATSKACKNQIMKHKQKPIYTSQFHPEFYNHKILVNFIRICEPKNSFR